MKKRLKATLVLLTAFILSFGCSSSCNWVKAAQSKNVISSYAPTASQNKAIQSVPQFSAEQIQQLRGVGIKIAVPTYVPPGFQIGSVRNISDAHYKGYKILYRRADNTCFSIEAITGGIGDDPELEHYLSYQSQLFGDGKLGYGRYTDSSLRQQFPQYEMSTGWMPAAHFHTFYRFNGANWADGHSVKPRCNKDITPTEAIRVIESLNYLQF